jgi:localization factor PodJL
VRQKRRSYRDDDVEDEDALSDNLAAVNERLDELTRQLERMAQAGAGRRVVAGIANERPPDRVADALAKLDRRLDQVIGEGRAAAHEIERRGQYAPPQPVPAAAPPQPTLPAGWAAQISARQRALEGGAVAAPAPQPQQAFQPQPITYAPPPPPPPPPQPAPLLQPAPQQNWAPVPDLSELQEQLREINTQISSLHQPYEQGLAALRDDLAEIARTLTAAMPRQAIEALEADVRALAERLDRSRQAGADDEALVALEHGLAGRKLGRL